MGELTATALLLLLLLFVLLAAASSQIVWPSRERFAVVAALVEEQELCTEYGGDRRVPCDPRPLLVLCLQRIAVLLGPNLRLGHNVTVHRAWKRADGRFRWIVDACFYSPSDFVGTCVQGLEVRVQALWDSPTPPTEWPLSYGGGSVQTTAGRRDSTDSMLLLASAGGERSGGQTRA
jgi:hypothetical protein